MRGETLKIPIRVVYCNTHTHTVLCSFGTLIISRGPPAMAVVPSPIKQSCMELGRPVEAAAATNSAGAALAGSHCVFTQLI